MSRRVLHVGWGFYPWRPGGLILYAQDLMAAQLERGHEVSYFFSGRHYPYVSGPRLKRWRHHGVAMREAVNPPLLTALEEGTREPERELSEPWLESAFRRVLQEARPDLVHIQELHGLPSSLVDIAGEAGVPTLMTLQDYQPLCTTLRLFDSDGRICMRRQVGADCVATNAGAPTDAKWLILQTIEFEVARVRKLLRLGPRFDFSALAPVVAKVYGRAMDSAEPPGPGSPARGAEAADLAPAYQRRREVNVERLGRVDRLVAQSPRVAEIYRTLGVPGERMSTLPFTLSHIERLRPRSLPDPSSPLTFATLNGCVSPSKGSETILAALRRLRAEGAEHDVRLQVFGNVQRDLRDELASFACVELRGSYESSELNSILDGVDVGLMPSMWEEALGYTGLELLAKGIPLIANPLGGIVEYAIEGQTAWLNPSCSGDGMADLMLALVREPRRVLDMHSSVVAARDLVVPRWRDHVEAMEGLYTEITG
jgi:glycosyltransferase involved in cell wall biosynthesis